MTIAMTKEFATATDSLAIMIPSSPQDCKTDASEDEPAIVSSQELLGGHRQLIIRHGRERYRLQLTNSNKLILTK
jgi:hemin uptake protein HemP